MINLIRKIKQFLKFFLPDIIILRRQYKRSIGENLNLKNPTSFNEKIQWLKVYGNLQKYTNLVDKYEVRKHVADTIGEEYLIPFLGVWDKAEDIDFDKLPGQFVLKCNHDCASVMICTDKTSFDIDAAKKNLNKHLKQNFYYESREPQYKNIKPKIICEKYMVDESGTELKDYKFFCFNGEPKFIQVNYDRSIDHKLNFYDTEWNYISIQLLPHKTDPNKVIDKPVNLAEMLDLAKILSKDYSFVRVDFYSIKNEIYFGELTFTPNSGHKEFKPKEFGIEIGSWIELPKENRK